MNVFARDVARTISSLDPTREVSSGYSLPRGSATHLQRRWEFYGGNADWTPDTSNEFAQNLLETQAPFNIVSIHVYSPDETRPEGPSPIEHFDPIVAAAEAVHAVKKKLFIGEFGDEKARTPFMTHTLADIVANRADYAAIWVWEFYQGSTYMPNQGSVEPGYSDALLSDLIATERTLGTAPPRPARDVPPRVVLTWPLPCAAVDGPINLTAVASEGARGVEKVEFLVDGQKIGVVTRPPYSIRFDPAHLASGIARITARATGASAITADFESPAKLNHSSALCSAAE
jgi:hypothetical protein